MTEDDNTTPEEALTSFEDTESKEMKEMMDKLRALAATATPADLAQADLIRRSGAGLRRETLSAVVCAVLVLRFNTQNRQISIKKVYGMVEDMLAGDWKPHHQGVAFTTAGLLGDGQHRFCAGALSGKGLVNVPVDSDFNMDSIDAIDRSTKRTAAQAAAMHGMVDADMKIPVGKAVLEYLHQINHGVKPRISDQKLQREVRAMEETFSLAIKIGKDSVHNVSAPSMSVKDATIVSAICLARGWDAEKVRGYLASVQQGIATYHDAPTLILSRRLLAAKDSVNRAKRLTAKERIALSCKAAKLWGQNVAASKLLWDERKEGMPDPSLATVELPAAAD